MVTQETMSVETNTRSLTLGKILDIPGIETTSPKKENEKDDINDIKTDEESKTTDDHDGKNNKLPPLPLCQPPATPPRSRERPTTGTYVYIYAFLLLLFFLIYIYVHKYIVGLKRKSFFILMARVFIFLRW